MSDEDEQDILDLIEEHTEDSHDCVSDDPIPLGSSTAHCRHCGAPTTNVVEPDVVEDDEE